eukprot:Amastigsp_a677837_1002.p4 type:complete len:128 gc:universal Amastigsp_a677837_1002:572-955(+)
MTNGLSVRRTGWVMLLSTASISFLMASAPISGRLPSSAMSAEPKTMGTLSPGNPYLESSSRSSISTSSSMSLSGTASTLLTNTTRSLMPTCLARSRCSRVCGIWPSTPETTRMAPSICDAPVIMFLT